MKIIGLLFLTLFLASCLPLKSEKQIVVDGEAMLEFEPEIFQISGSIRARAETQNEVLADIAAKHATIRETLPQLVGLTELKIDAADVQIKPVFNAVCLETSRYGQNMSCPVDGYFGVIDLSVSGSPAALSGNTISLLSELGAESVELTAYLLANLKEAQAAALDAAVRDAAAKANEIAAAANASLGGAVRIQHGEGFGNSGLYDQNAFYSPEYSEQIVVSATRKIGPAIGMDLDPQPIMIRAKVVASFAIE